jgi:hypothetical protein
MSNLVQYNLGQQIKNNAEKLFGKPEPAPRIDNGPLLAETGLRIVHFNRVEEGGRSMTVAFKTTGSLVEVATAITHPSDAFTRKLGTKTAVEAFLAGKTVRIPMPKVWQGQSATYIKTLFEVV